uniref:ferroxidase n=1 Tax=Acanthochromis polyacanthus TaxID=80966 RepID=A0A3Q1GC09_9TELE
KKVVFREYDKDFRQAKTHPSWLGLLGPTLRAEENDTIVVTFRNMATGAYSIHPHGVAYGKQSEGANYFDNTSQKEKEDDMVRPNGEHVYYWEVTPAVSPQQHDPACLTYTYISHQNVVEDYNSGLIGTLLICKPGERENAFYLTSNHVKYTINGYTRGSLPDVSVCAHSSVSLHLVGMSSEPEVFSVHLNGQVLQQTGHKVSSVGLISGSSTTASMVALHTGRWLLSSHITKHMEGKPSSDRNTVTELESMEWKYYIAAEEVVWDYTPNTHEHIDDDFKHMYLKQSATRIGCKYKKAVYTQYTNESFTEKVMDKQRKNELGILGPVIRAQIRDVIKIVFKNMASRPYSIYPHGLTVEKSEEGVNYPEGGNQSHGVQPGETHTYVWKVVEEDEPLDGDPRCLTRMYHSAVNTPRDIASGLIGPILICKSQSLNLRNVQLKADKEQHAMFAVFDENKSWYLDDNIRRYSDQSRVNKADPNFYKSNVMHTINGYMFESGPLLGFCNGEVATWHMSSIGAQDYIQTATFYGHPFELNKRTEDFLSLYPMTGETISMNMLNVGVWLLASLNSHETNKGMRLKFQDVECYRDRQYEYDYDEIETNSEFTVWNPQSLDEIKKKEEENAKPVETETPAVIDEYTYGFAEELGLRSLKNKSSDSDMEQLDLSYFDYDYSDRDTDRTSKDKTEKSKPKTDALNVTLSSNRIDVGGQNFTKVNLLNQSISENTTYVQNINGQDKSHIVRETKFTKVVFRGYMDSSFTTPDIRGEVDEHLGILGPVINAEVGQSILVVFRNKANRPYSVHPNGVSYTKQTEGLSYEDGSKYWYKYDNEVQPNTTFTYLWKVTSMVGPNPGESDCRIWAYYSGVNPEKDIHSGLIGPLLVCREGTLDKKLKDSREFVLLFMTFDESQSWYYEKNCELMQRKTRRRVLTPYLGENLKFHAINGIIYSLKGLRMYTDQLVRWHLINMGSPKDFHSVYFHGQTFLHKKTTSYRHAVYPLLPGSFATLEMHPSKPGLWQLETEVGFSQQKGMQTLFLVLDNDCYRPLGLQSGSVKDKQITAINTRGYWEPHLARLDNGGKYNAWSTDRENSWIQVDFQRPVVISQVATQGAKQMFQSQFVKQYSISYSNDRRKWIFYKGDSRDFRKVSLNVSFSDATTTNTFFPPVIGRFIRLHPITWYSMATVRMEFYGCELDGCSVPLGMESELIEDGKITASSTATSWYSGPWKASLARLNKQGTINAWRAKVENQWLKVELPQVKKITGIITQGAKSLGSEMFVTSYILQYSDNGIHWTDYTDDEDQPHRIFIGNKNNNDHVKNYIYPPIFSRFVKIIPRSWSGSITMRVELLGCDFE